MKHGPAQQLYDGILNRCDRQQLWMKKIRDQLLCRRSLVAAKPRLNRTPACARGWRVTASRSCSRTRAPPPPPPPPWGHQLAATIAGLGSGGPRGRPPRACPSVATGSVSPSKGGSLRETWAISRRQQRLADQPDYDRWPQSWTGCPWAFRCASVHARPWRGGGAELTRPQRSWRGPSTRPPGSPLHPRGGVAHPRAPRLVRTARGRERTRSPRASTTPARLWHSYKPAAPPALPRRFASPSTPVYFSARPLPPTLLPPVVKPSRCTP